MQEIIDQVRAANNAGLYYVALLSVLTVPDMCAALESESGETNGARYKAWFDKYVAPKYKFFEEVSLTGEVCWYYRCSVLHQGRSTHPRMKYERIFFIEPNERFVLHNNIFNDALNIDINIFCEDIIAGYEDWLEVNKNNQIVMDNLQKGMKRYPNGLQPYVSGLPVIS